MANSSDSLTSAISAATGIPDDQVMSKLGSLSIEQWGNMINAVNDGNHTEVKNIVDTTASDNSSETNPLMAKNSAEAQGTSQAAAQPAQAPQQQTPPAQPQAPSPAPAQASSDAQPAAQPTTEPENDDETTNESVGADDHSYTLGDAVEYDGKECTVSKTKAVEGCIELLVDGVPRIVKKSKVSPVRETILGPLELAAISRIRELAGMNSPATMQVAKTRTVEVPQAPAVQARTIATPTTMDFCLDLPEDPIEEIKDAFADIMTALPEIKQRDVKDVRAMTNNVFNSLNEDRYSFIKELAEPSKKKCYRIDVKGSYLKERFPSIKSACEWLESHKEIGYSEVGDDEMWWVSAAGTEYHISPWPRNQ